MCILTESVLNERGLLFKANSTMSCREQVNCQWDDDAITHYARPTGFYSASSHNSPRIDMSPDSEILSWFRTNQSLFFLLNVTCIADKQQMPSLYPLVWPDRRIESTIYWTRCKHANHSIMVFPVKTDRIFNLIQLLFCFTFDMHYNSVCRLGGMKTKW